MNSPKENISMNSGRAKETNKESSLIFKEIILEKDLMIKNLFEKNELLTRENLKYKMSNKSLEDKLKILTEKNYKVN